MSRPTPNTKAAIRDWMQRNAAAQPRPAASTEWITCTECVEEAGDTVLCPKHLSERNER